jgi:hypothetical protein
MNRWMKAESVIPTAATVNTKVVLGRYDGLGGDVGGDGVEEVFSCGFLVFWFFI